MFTYSVRPMLWDTTVESDWDVKQRFARSSSVLLELSLAINRLVLSRELQTQAKVHEDTSQPIVKRARPIRKCEIIKLKRVEGFVTSRRFQKQTGQEMLLWWRKREVNGDTDSKMTSCQWSNAVIQFSLNDVYIWNPYQLHLHWT